MTREKANNIARGITDKIEATTDIDDWAEFWGFTRDDYEEFLDVAIEALSAEPCEDCISREFIEIVVNYPPADLCTYPEYRGKPYFSIKYRENGNGYVGFGTYKIEMLSQWIKEYFMPSIQPKPIEGDAISRKEALDLVEDMTDQFGTNHRVVTEGMISLLPSVTPKPKTDVLDKIRAEIEEQVLESLSDGGDDWFAAEKVNECLQIINKYKAESEDKK